MVDEFLRQFASKKAIERHEEDLKKTRDKIEEINKAVRYYKNKKEEDKELRKLAKWLLIAQILIFAVPVTISWIFIWLVENF